MEGRSHTGAQREYGAVRIDAEMGARTWERAAQNTFSPRGSGRNQPRPTWISDVQPPEPAGSKQLWFEATQSLVLGHSHPQDMHTVSMSYCMKVKLLGMQPENALSRGC